MARRRNGLDLSCATRCSERGAGGFGAARWSLRVWSETPVCVVRVPGRQLLRRRSRGAHLSLGAGEDVAYGEVMKEAARFRIAAILFSVAGAASAVCALLALAREGAGVPSALFVASAGLNSLAGALCHRKHRKLAVAPE